MKEYRQNSNEKINIVKICKGQIKSIGLMVAFLLFVAVLNAILPQLSVTLIDEGLVVGKINITIVFALLILVLSIIISIIYLLIEHFRLKVFNDIQAELKDKSIKKLFALNSSFYDKKSATTIYQQLDEDIAAILGCFDTETLITISEILITIFLIPVLIGINFKLTIFLFLSIPVYSLSTLLLSKLGYKYAKEKIVAKNEYSTSISNVINGIHTIRSFGLFKHFLNDSQIKQKNIEKAHYRLGIFSIINVRCEDLFSNLLVFIFYVIGGYLIVGKEISLGEFFSFQTYSFSILNFVGQLLELIYGYQSIKPSFERFNDFLGEDEEHNSGEIKNIKNGDIEFRNVTFGYDSQNIVIKNISLSVKKGKHIAIVGKNGSGKSTLINLLLRNIIPDAGEVVLNGFNINYYDIDSYRDLFCVLQQEPFLFCDTVENNICLYKRIDPCILEKAIAIAGLSEFIEEKGVNYSVGQNGSEISGGQRQRIAIARILVQDKPIIVFDEPEVNIDNDFSLLFERVIKKLCNNKTVIVITHNDEILDLMDEVYRFDDDNKNLRKIR